MVIENGNPLKIIENGTVYWKAWWVYTVIRIP